MNFRPEVYILNHFVLQKCFRSIDFMWAVILLVATLLIASCSLFIHITSTFATHLQNFVFILPNLLGRLFKTYTNTAMPRDKFFIRELHLEIEDCKNKEPLRLYQKPVGDVNCIVWDAAIVLAKYLERTHNANKGFLHGVSVIELGAGVGCAGLTAACLGADVTLTDLQHSVPILKYNIDKNRRLFTGTARALTLTWGDHHVPFKPDKILLADCVYYRESIGPLVATLRRLSTDRTEILQVQEMRESTEQQENWRLYVEALTEHFDMVEVPAREQDPQFQSDDIKLYKIYRKM